MMACVFEPEIDQATADLILQLQLQDTHRSSSSSKKKSRDPRDEELAFHLQVEELETTSKLLSDRRMARSFATAVQAPESIVTENQLEENVATKDRDIARRWTEDDNSPSAENPLTQPGSEDIDEEILRKPQIQDASESRDDCDKSDSQTADAGSSAWGAHRSSMSTEMQRCIACYEQRKFVNVIRAPCCHEYCITCLEALFRASITDESLSPPRCCQRPIPLSTARIYLKPDLVHQYSKKKIEYETPNRTYCSLPRCSTFIDASHVNGEIATCPECNYTTCTLCKERAHTGDCPADTALQQLLNTARENGWKRCYSCWRVIELGIGCNHMICPCGAQFCYSCGMRWKTCACPQWEEDRLYARVDEVLDRGRAEFIAAAVNPIFEEEQIRLGDMVTRAVQMLHECDHRRWRFRHGPHICEECYHYLDQYIFECRRCRLQACNRCRRNRL